MPKILIVDDDEGLRILFSKRLIRAGMEVVEARNGQEGLAIAQQLQPDLIILDYEMPGMSGDVMLRALRQSGWGRDIKVIMVTNAPPLQQVPGTDKADLVLYKPVSTLELITMVRRLLLAAPS